MSDMTRGSGGSGDRPPHPATVAQGKGLRPHPATVVQARESHPAQVAQPKPAFGGRSDRPPHAAPVEQGKACPSHQAPGHGRQLPPHPATVVQARVPQPGSGQPNWASLCRVLQLSEEQLTRKQKEALRTREMRFYQDITRTHNLTAERRGHDVLHRYAPDVDPDDKSEPPEMLDARYWYRALDREEFLELKKHSRLPLTLGSYGGIAPDIYYVATTYFVSKPGRMIVQFDTYNGSVPPKGVNLYGKLMKKVGKSGLYKSDGRTGSIGLGEKGTGREPLLPYFNNWLEQGKITWRVVALNVPNDMI